MANPRVSNLLTAPREDKNDPRVFARQALVGDQADLVNIYYVNIQPGFMGGSHFHEHSENVYLVLRGSPTVVVDGVRHVLAPHDVIFIPRGVDHAAGNESDSEVEMVEIYAPPKAPGDSHPSTRG